MLRNADRFRRGSRFKRGRRFRKADRKLDKNRREEQSENFQDGWRSRAVLFLVSQCITLFGSTLVQMAVFGPLADVVPLQWIMIGVGGALAALSALTGGSGGAEEEKQMKKNK